MPSRRFYVVRKVEFQEIKKVKEKKLGGRKRKGVVDLTGDEHEETLAHIAHSLETVCNFCYRVRNCSLLLP